MISKCHHWFKSDGDFADWVDFAYWWSCIGKGLRLQHAQQACYCASVQASLVEDIKPRAWLRRGQVQKTDNYCLFVEYISWCSTT